jgi:hypothetical protein
MASRTQTDELFAVVRAHMTHHSGMSFLALDHLLARQPMQRRFMANPEFRAVAMLLEERLPEARPRIGSGLQAVESPERTRVAEAVVSVTRTFATADTPCPEVHLLSNGRCHVVITNSGGSFSRWRHLNLTRWREDVTRDNWGTFFYVRDLKAGRVWSTTHQSTCASFDRYEVTYSQGLAEFRSLREDLEVHTRIAVWPEDDVELRRMVITNTSNRSRTIEITSYAEVVLAQPRSESGHLVFEGLFVETEIVPERHAILCTRRPRSAERASPRMVQPRSHKSPGPLCTSTWSPAVVAIVLPSRVWQPTTRGCEGGSARADPSSRLGAEAARAHRKLGQRLSVRTLIPDGGHGLTPSEFPANWSPITGCSLMPQSAVHRTPASLSKKSQPLCGIAPYRTLNGTNTASVITSCRIFSWATVMTPCPSRLAGTWSGYSKNAIPQRTTAASSHDRPASNRRCPYQANVMKQLDSTSMMLVVRIVFMGPPAATLAGGARILPGHGDRPPPGLGWQ